MFHVWRNSTGWLVAGLLAVGGIAQLLMAQNAPIATRPVAQGRFEFEIVESFDAQYLGDTPGHIGRHGELGDNRPRVALGDHVYRDEKKVGKISRVEWSRPHGSLEVEFDPEPFVRISVGDIVWLQLEGEQK